MLAMPEIIWTVKPDFIIEPGVDIRPHRRTAIEAHPLFRRIELIEGSSVDVETVAQVSSLNSGARNIMVVLDNDHTHDYVLKELVMYQPFVSDGNFRVVFDTAIELLDHDMFPDRP